MGLDLEDLLYLFIQPGIGRERNVVIDEYLPLLLFVLSIEPHDMNNPLYRGCGVLKTSAVIFKSALKRQKYPGEEIQCKCTTRALVEAILLDALC